MAEEKLKQYNALLKECENDLKHMCPVFEFNTKAVANLKKKAKPRKWQIWLSNWVLSL